jgi:GNAT superfamily N-acetyltransferase
MMMWELFKKHHYLTEKLNKASRCFIAKWQDKIIGFESMLPMPCGTLKNAWREHRLVILSDFQGLGIGNILSECVSEILKREGKRIYSKTANKKLGAYRNKSPLWRATSQNNKNRKELVNNNNNGLNGQIKYDSFLLLRTCFSHEYIGKINENIQTIN